MKSSGAKFIGMFIMLILTLAMLIMPQGVGALESPPGGGWGGALAVSTLAATEMTNNTVTLNGNLIGSGTAATVNVSFEYGYTTAYGKTTPAQPLAAIGAFGAPVTGLFPGMVWHFRAKVVGDSTVYGDDMTCSTTSAVYGTGKFTFVSARDGNQEVYAITPDGAYSARFTENIFEEAWPRFAPDFTKVTFTSWRDGNAEIYWMNPDGTGQARITTNTAFDGMSDFSWNGSRIAFVSDRDGNYEIYVMNTDGTGQTRITNNTAVDIMPAFSPDGSKIAFASNSDGDYEIYVMSSIDGSGLTKLTDNAVVDGYPSWMNDGTQICFTSMLNGISEIYTMGANGANQSPLMNNALPPAPVAGDQPAWCPTGGAITYTSWATNNTPQIMFIGAGPNVGMGPFPFTTNAEGNWNRANWTMPSAQSYTLTYTAGANGTITGTSPQTVASGASGTTVTAVPATGYHFVSWSDASIANPRTDTNVTANITVTASFAIDAATSFTCTYTAGANGTITGTSPQTVGSGASGTAVTAVPATGYHFVSWSDASTANPRTDTNVTANVTVMASFAINNPPQEITISIAAGADDGFSNSGIDGYSNTSTWFQAGKLTNGLSENAWFRFTGITLPAGAVIDEAYMEVIQSRFDTGTSLKIYAEDAANPAVPTNTNDQTSRVRTTAGATWTTGYSDGQWHNSPDLTSVISELVASYTYNAGVIQILVDDNGSTGGSEVAGTTFENNGFAPKLHIRYHVVTSVTITASVTGGGGTVSPTGMVAVNMGANQTFTITANSGYHITDVLVDAVSQGAIGTYTFNNLIANHAIAASFAVDASSGGSGSSGGSSSSGGGGGGVVNTPSYTNLSSYVGNDGIVTADATAHSRDNKVVLDLATGTQCLTTSGTPAKIITITPRLDVLAPPTGSGVIGLPYNFGPEGATFDPGISVTMSYAGLNLGSFDENNLALAYWDSQAAQWVKLSGYQVDTVKKTITANIAHFSTYGILGYLPAPAEFTISNLVLTPASVEAGKDVTVTLSVTNTGELSGVYTANLMVGGTTEATKDVTVEGGETEQVNFVVNRPQTGTYTLSIGDLNGSFTSLKPAAYTISDLVVSPASGEAGQDITVSFKVVNTGETRGTYKAALQIGDLSEAERDIALTAGESQTVTFIVVRSEPGTYNVRAGGLTNSFTILVPIVLTTIETTTPTQTGTDSATAAALPVSQSISRWWWIGLILAVAFLVIALITTIRRTYYNNH